MAEARSLTGMHGGPVGRQDLGTVRTCVLEFLLLQRAVQVAADAAQFRGDGRLAEVRAHRLRARGAGVVRTSSRARPALPHSRARPALTSTMCSLGSRPQSASVSWSPSRKRRRDSRSCGSRANSCSRGARRYLSSLARARSSSWYRAGVGAEGFGEDPVWDATPPTVAAAADPLTIILPGHRVLDEGGELVKDVVARGCGLPIAGRQAGESGVEEELMSDRRAAGAAAPFLGSVLGAPPAVPRPSLGGSQRLLQKLLDLQRVGLGVAIIEQDGQL